MEEEDRLKGIPKRLITELLHHLIHQRGDHRICPKCGSMYILEDWLSKEALDLFQELENYQD